MLTASTTETLMHSAVIAIIATMISAALAPLGALMRGGSYRLSQHLRSIAVFFVLFYVITLAIHLSRS